MKFGGVFDSEAVKKRIAEKETLTGQPDFWNDPKKAEQLLSEIKKLKNGNYQFWDYASDTGDENESPRITNAVKEKNVLCDEYICIGYDTKLKDPVILNRKTKRIISIVRENHDKIDDPEHLKEFPEDNPEMYKLYRDYYKLYK